MQSVRDVLRQRTPARHSKASNFDAIRAGCAEAKLLPTNNIAQNKDAIRAGCAEAKSRTAETIIDVD